MGIFLVGWSLLNLKGNGGACGEQNIGGGGGGGTFDLL